MAIEDRRKLGIRNNTRKNLSKASGYRVYYATTKAFLGGTASVQNLNASGSSISGRRQVGTPSKLYRPVKPTGFNARYIGVPRFLPIPLSGAGGVANRHVGTPHLVGPTLHTTGINNGNIGTPRLRGGTIHVPGFSNRGVGTPHLYCAILQAIGVGGRPIIGNISLLGGMLYATGVHDLRGVGTPHLYRAILHAIPVQHRGIGTPTLTNPQAIRLTGFSSRHLGTAKLRGNGLLAEATASPTELVVATEGSNSYVVGKGTIIFFEYPTGSQQTVTVGTDNLSVPIGSTPGNGGLPPTMKTLYLTLREIDMGWGIMQDVSVHSRELGMEWVVYMEPTLTLSELDMSWDVYTTPKELYTRELGMDWGIMQDVSLKSLELDMGWGIMQDVSLHTRDLGMEWSVAEQAYVRTRELDMEYECVGKTLRYKELDMLWYARVPEAELRMLWSAINCNLENDVLSLINTHRATLSPAVTPISLSVYAGGGTNVAVTHTQHMKSLGIISSSSSSYPSGWQNMSERMAQFDYGSPVYYFDAGNAFDIDESSQPITASNIYTWLMSVASGVVEMDFAPDTNVVFQLAIDTFGSYNGSPQNQTIWCTVVIADLGTAYVPTLQTKELDISYAVYADNPWKERTLDMKWGVINYNVLTDLLALINSARAMQHPPRYPVTLSIYNGLGMDIATRQAENISETGVLAHESDAFPAGWQTFDQRLGWVRESPAGGAENLAQLLWPASSGPVTASYIFDLWMNSAPHRANILANWDEDTIAIQLGFGLHHAGAGYPYENPDEVYYVCNVFLDTTPRSRVMITRDFNMKWGCAGALIEYLDMQWSVDAYAHVDASNTALYSILLETQHKVDYSYILEVQHEVSVYYTLDASNETAYGSTALLDVGHELDYRIEQYVFVDAQHESTQSLLLEAYNIHTFSDCSKVVSSVTATYGDSQILQTSSLLLYEDCTRLQISSEVSYGDYLVVQTSSMLTYQDCTQLLIVHAAAYGDTALIDTACDVQYGSCSLVSTQLDLTYGNCAKVDTAVEVYYSIRPMVDWQHQIMYGDQVLVDSQIEYSYDMLLNNNIHSSHKSVYSVLGDADTLPSYGFPTIEY